jgi:hypothetical protein
MARPNVLFGSVTDVERGASVGLAGGIRARFAPDDNRAVALTTILDGLRGQKMPVYLEVDGESGFVSRVRLPMLVRVRRIIDSGTADVAVDFRGSQARLRVRRDDPERDEILRTLRNAGTEQWLAVTASDRSELLDARPYDLPAGIPPYEPPAAARWWQSRIWPWNWSPGCVSQERAQQLFDLCASRSCDPLEPSSDCIPFLYPDHGCQARAHEMCRLLVEAGAMPRKLWIEGVLTPRTRNHPECSVLWVFHTAPTLCVRRWFFFRQEQVLDPALFATPVTRFAWKSRMEDPTVRFSSAPWEVFEHLDGLADEYDLGFSKTRESLRGTRAQLQMRSLENGPPPYANCP